MDEGYEKQRLRVDPTPEYPDGWAEFAGNEIERISVVDQGEEKTYYGWYTFYETPRDGYVLYAVESVTEAPDNLRPPGQKAPSGFTTRALYSEEEAKQLYPEIFERFLSTLEE